MSDLIPLGPHWCQQFPTSTSLDDLLQPFQGNCRRFIDALEARGALIIISATHRPRERAYLMHYACMIGQGKQAPDLIPPMPGVEIAWDAGDSETTRTLAAQMVKTYGIVFPPALESRHTQGLAIDMSISGINGVSDQEILGMGKNFGVIKLISDPPHWSIDGH